MSNKITDLAKQIKNSLTISPDELDKLQAEHDAKTQAMIGAINDDQKEANDKIARLKEAVKKALKDKYPGLLVEIYQFSREETIQVNAYHDVIYTFTLQPKFADLENMLSDRLEKIELPFEFESDKHTIYLRVDVKRK